MDYVGIFRSLQKALAIYAQPSRPGEMPIREKASLVALLVGLIDQAVGHCQQRGVNLPAIVKAAPAQRLPLLMAAREALIDSDDDRKAYLQVAGQVARAFKAILPDAAANAHAPLAVLVTYLGAMIKALMPPADISAVTGDIEALLNDSIATEGYRIGAPPQGQGLIDLSQIDFGKLQQKFDAGSDKRSQAEQLKGQVQAQVARLVALNGSRVDFLKKFEALIAAYNAGSHNVESFFSDLVAFAKALTEEQQRTLREGLDEEELAIFDILTRPAPTMTDKERGEVKKVAKELLATLKQAKLVLDWRAKPQARAEVERTIRDHYIRLPAAYSGEARRDKRALTFAHLFDHYYGAGGSAYGAR